MENCEQPVENQTYRLEEMIEAMKASIENISAVCGQQMKLIEVCQLSNYRDDFKDFVKEVYEQIDELNRQKSALEKKCQIISEVVELCHTDEVVSDAVSKLLLGLEAINQ